MQASSHSRSCTTWRSPSHNSLTPRHRTQRTDQLEVWTVAALLSASWDKMVRRCLPLSASERCAWTVRSLKNGCATASQHGSSVAKSLSQCSPIIITTTGLVRSSRLGQASKSRWWRPGRRRSFAHRTCAGAVGSVCIWMSTSIGTNSPTSLTIAFRPIAPKKLIAQLYSLA